MTAQTLTSEGCCSFVDEYVAGALSIGTVSAPFLATFMTSGVPSVAASGLVTVEASGLVSAGVSALVSVKVSGVTIKRPLGVASARSSCMTTAFAICLSGFCWSATGYVLPSLGTWFTCIELIIVHTVHAVKKLTFYGRTTPTATGVRRLRLRACYAYGYGRTSLRLRAYRGYNYGRATASGVLWACDQV